MATEVFMPKTGIYQDDVTLVEWLVEEGGHVDEGQDVLIMETEKVEVEVQADASGWLHHIIEPEATLAIGTVVGMIADTEQEYAALKASSAGDGA